MVECVPPIVFRAYDAREFAGVKAKLRKVFYLPENVKIIFAVVLLLTGCGEQTTRNDPYGGMSTACNGEYITMMNTQQKLTAAQEELANLIDPEQRATAQEEVDRLQEQLVQDEAYYEACAEENSQQLPTNDRSNPPLL